MPIATPLADSLREQLYAVLDRHGEQRARNKLGISRMTLARALAGLPVQPGAAALIRESLAVLEREATP